MELLFSRHFVLSLKFSTEPLIKLLILKNQIDGIVTFSEERNILIMPEAYLEWTSAMVPFCENN